MSPGGRAFLFMFLECYALFLGWRVGYFRRVFLVVVVSG